LTISPCTGILELVRRRASPRSIAFAWLACLAWLCLLAPSAHASLFFGTEGKVRIAPESIDYRTDGSAADVPALATRKDGWGPAPVKAPIGTPLWARFTVPSNLPDPAEYVSGSSWESIDFYFVRGGQLVSHQRVGTLVPQAERPVQLVQTSALIHPGFAEINLVPDQPTVVLARLESSGRFVKDPYLGFSLWSAHNINMRERADRFTQGLFYGLMLFLVVYNFGLFVVTHDLSYLGYVVMEGGFTMAWAVLFGQAFEYLWPAYPALDYYMMWAAMVAGGVGMAVFLRTYLDTPLHFPKFDRVLWWYAWLVPLILPLPLVPGMTFELLGNILTSTGPFSGVLVAVLVVRAWRARHPLARNLAFAMGCMWAGMLTYVGADAGLLPLNAFTEHGMQLGSASMGLVLSFGIAQRLRRMRDELDRREQERLALVQSQNQVLEARVAERTIELAQSRDRSDALLANILPRPIIEELARRGSVEPRRHEEVSILFTDFEGFTSAVAMIPAGRLVQELDELFRGFDEIISAHGLEKIKTIGDAYMAAAGLPLPAEDHAQRCVAAGLALCRYIAQRNSGSAMKWGLRVGVHSGAVVAGIVGKDKYAYDVWGDTVNVASRLESAGVAGRVNVSAYTYELARERFEGEYRGKIAAKGKGEVDMYFVVAERDIAEALTPP
jgi:class 3 adenylate cyclase